MSQFHPNRRNDPAIKKMIIVVYVLYYIGLVESIFLPLRGIVTVLGFAFILFQTKAIKESSYFEHYRWLVMCMIVLLLFAFFNIIIPIGTKPILFQSKYIGQLGYFILVTHGFFCLLSHRPLPSIPPNKSTIPSKKID